MEIEKVLLNNKNLLTYDTISKMVFLDRVILETVRKYPICDTQFRKCRKDFKIPDTDLVIPESSFIAISTFAFHRDEKYFKNPENFDPERFNAENRRKQTPFTYMPFGITNIYF